MMNSLELNLPDYLSKISERAEVRAAMPLGAQECGGGVNVAIFSRYASRVRLEPFDQPDDVAPALEFDLDSARNPTDDVWHISVKAIASE